jgi:hypothetical protein
MRQAQQETAHIGHSFQENRIARQLDEDILENIPRIGFVSGKVQKEGKQSLRVLIIETVKLKRRRHRFIRRRANRRVLSTKQAYFNRISRPVSADV